MTSHNNKILNLLELNEESSQILDECAKNNITSTNLERINLKMLEETNTGLKLEMALTEVEAKLEEIDCRIREQTKETDNLKNLLKEYAAETRDLKTGKMIEKLTAVNKELQTPEDVNLEEIIHKVKKLQK